MYKRLIDVNKELEELHNNGLQRGASVGWDWDKFPFTIKLGTTTYLAAPPHQGKTEFWFECLINLSCLHSWKHCIFSPETGSAAEIYAELISKFVGKPYFGSLKMKQSEKVHGEMFINEHFVVIDPVDEDMTIEQYYKLVEDIENQQGLKFHTTTIDPMNELKEVFLPEDAGRDDKFLSRILGFVRKNAKKNNRHNCLITHVRDQVTVVEDNIRYNPIPTARDFANGQSWFRKGMLMGIIWRPPYGLADSNGVNYKANQTVFKVAKSKPKGVSSNGLYNFYLDVEKYRYYMEDERGLRVYADRGQYNESKPKEPEQITIETAIKPNLEFDIPKEVVKPKVNTDNSDWLETKEIWE
jgi:hypothetical protein